MTTETANKFRIYALLFALTLTASAAASRPKASTTSIPPFPGTLVNAKYVYVTSYDGDEFNVNLIPEDRRAITVVQDAMRSWGKFTVVYEPREADIVLMVTSRPTEDVLAVYDAHRWPGYGLYLWRMMGRSGLQAGETPLITNLKKAFEAATAGK